MVDAVLKLSSIADMTAQVQCNSEHSTTARRVRTLQLQPGAAHAHQTTPVSVQSTWAENWACHVARCQCLVSIGYAASGLWWMPCHRFSGYFDEATTRPCNDGAKGTQCFNTYADQEFIMGAKRSKVLQLRLPGCQYVARDKPERACVCFFVFTGKNAFVPKHFHLGSRYTQHPEADIPPIRGGRRILQ
jgi:hypothetical protein